MLFIVKRIGIFRKMIDQIISLYEIKYFILKFLNTWLKFLNREHLTTFLHALLVQTANIKRLLNTKLN